MKKCIRCGCAIEDDALFCPECGTNQAAVPQAAPVQGAVPGAAPQSVPAQGTAPAAPQVNIQPAAPARDPVPAAPQVNIQPAAPAQDPAPAAPQTNVQPAAPAQDPVPAAPQTNVQPAAPAQDPAPAAPQMNAQPTAPGMAPQGNFGQASPAYGYAPQSGAPAYNGYTAPYGTAAPYVKKQRKRHPVLSVFLLIFFFIFFNVGLLTGYFRHLVSEDNIRGFFEDTELSSLEIGGYLSKVLDHAEKNMNHGKYEEMLDSLSEGVDLRHFDDDLTLGELIVIRNDYLGDYTRGFESEALDDRDFKKMLVKIITSYTNDIFFGEGKGKLEADDIAELCYDFYYEYTKESLRYAKKIGRISDREYDYLTDMLDWPESKREVYNDVLRDIDQNELNDYSVKRLTKDFPLWAVRLGFSGIVTISLIALGIVFLLLAFIVNIRPVKRFLVSVIVVTVLEALLIVGFFIAFGYVKGLLIDESAKLLAEYIISLM